MVGFSANAISAKTIALIPIDTSKVIFDPALKPIFPIEENNPVIPPYKPLPIPEVKIPPELFQGPTISDVVLAVNTDSLLVEWKTNKPATSKLDYGNTSTYTKSLEDKELVTKHAMAIPVSVGQVNIRISSEDALGKKTETENIIIMIPDNSTEEDINEPIKEDADSKIKDDDVKNEPEAIKDDIDIQKSQNNTETVQPILKINDTELPAEKENTLTATNAILGGIAILLAGILIGVLVNNSKSNKTKTN